MRPRLLLAAVILTASSANVWSQSPTPSSLPTVEKPKSPVIKKKTIDPEPQPTPDGEIDLNKVPDPNAPARPLSKAKRDSEAQPEAGSGTGAAEVSTGPEYTGPSILSRGMNFSRPALPTNERFRPFVGINFYHDSGVSGAYQGFNSKVVSDSFSGADINYGITGQHARRSDTFQLDYRGHNYFANGSTAQDQILAFSYARVLNRRLTLSLAESAGVYANNYALLNSVTQTDTSVANTSLVVTPNTEAFDNKTYYTSTQADLTYQKSARLSIDFGGSVFYVKRQSANLISANGYQARSDVAYRISKRTTIGPYYAYSRYNYSGTFGDTDIHTVGGNYSFALSKSLQFRIRGGGTRLETRGLQQVTLDPFVARILGTSIGTQRYYSASFLTDFAFDLTRSFRHGELGFSYLRGVSPGNGVILTSLRDSQTVNYTFSGIKKYGVNLGAGRDGLASSVQTIGTYHSYYGRANISHALPNHVQSFFSFDYRKLGFTTGQYARNQFRISIGLGYAPGLGPLKFW